MFSVWCFYRPQVPKECRRPVEAPEMLSSSCSRECRNGHCTPTGKCCCNNGWEGPFCLRGETHTDTQMPLHIIINTGVKRKARRNTVFCSSFTAKCEPACRNGGVCIEPNKCFCKEGFSGAQCEKGEQGVQEDRDKDGILDHIIDMTSYLLDLTSYIV